MYDLLNSYYIMFWMSLVQSGFDEGLSTLLRPLFRRGLMQQEMSQTKGGVNKCAWLRDHCPIRFWIALVHFGFNEGLSAPQVN